MITAKEAKEICIEVWEYLAEHPTVDSKSSLPKRIFNKVRDKLCMCPLCELFFGGFAKCVGCPLGSCTEFGDAFERWAEPSKYDFDNTIAVREKAAKEILAKIKAWEV